MSVLRQQNHGKSSSSKATPVARILLSPESSAGRQASNMIAIAKKTHRDRATSLIAMTSSQAKSIQNLLSVVCMWKISEMETMRTSSMQQNFASLYHGNRSKDILGQMDQFVTGTRSYANVWTLDESTSCKIDNAWGTLLAGLPKASLKFAGKHLLGQTNMGATSKDLTG
jgi:hypothetical protein